MNKNIIELNGKKYDALTGAFLGKSTKVPVGVPSPHKRSGRVIDGFIHPVAAAAKPKPVATKVESKPVAAKAAPAKAVAKERAEEKKIEKEIVKQAPVASEAVEQPTKMAKAAGKPAETPSHTHAPAHIIKPHQPEHAKTLMGRAAKKPKFSLKPAIKVQGPAEVAIAPASGITPKRSADSLDPNRLVRAQHTAKHAAVSRFPKTHTHNGITLPHHSGFLTPTPVIAVQPAPLTSVSHVATPHLAKPHMDIFEAAIAAATSHTQPAHRIKRSKRRKLANMLAGGTALLVIAGFITFLNIPNIEVHVASIQAGFHANLPGYTPTGYALAGHVQRTGDTVSMRFTSGENKFTLTQQPSNWDNQTLLENTLPLQSGHQTIEVGGRTVYVYNNSEAVWVTGNIRYDLTGNAPLKTSDISNLAMSL